MSDMKPTLAEVARELTTLNDGALTSQRAKFIAEFVLRHRAQAKREALEGAADLVINSTRSTQARLTGHNIALELRRLAAEVTDAE